MPKIESETLAINKNSLIRILTLVAVLIFVLSGWFWWHNVYMSPDNVFWDMINNNLATTSVTKHVLQTNQAQSLDQYIQLQFGATNSVHSLVTLKQGQGSATATIKSETIGTPKTDYNRYVSIDSQQTNSKGLPINSSNVVGVWAKADSNPYNGPQYFRQGLFDIMPFANLDSAARKQIIQLIRDKKVYNISATPAKTSRINGRQVFVYSASVNPAAYVEVIVQIAKSIGLGDIGLDATQYQNSPNLNLQIYVDKLSRQLIKISYPSTGQEETYSSQGLENPIIEPTNTISVTELQNRIQQNLK